MTLPTRPNSNRLFRIARRSAVLFLVAVFALAVWDVTTYDPKAWREDFGHLKRELAQRYANLDWIVTHRGLDLPALDAETDAALEHAHSRVRAVLALRRFVHAFADPHLRLVRGDRNAQTTATASAVPPAVPPAPPLLPALDSFEDAGYEAGDSAFRFPFDRLPGWTPLRTDPFPSGLAVDLGVLRIASFGEDQYEATGQAAFRAGMTTRDLRLAVRARLQRELIESIEDLKARGAQRLLVDVTGNGGGTEWVTEVVALLTDRELVRLSSRLVAPSGDRSGIWRGESVPSVFGPADRPARLVGTGVWRGPLYILADRGTGSASEDFVAWLQQNKVARVLGARTAGAGGGYVNGGGRIRLSAGPLDVMAPNCARFLDDGTNEIEGIAPDVELPMQHSNLDQLAAALAAALSR
jgi:hypothetical protein